MIDSGVPVTIPDTRTDDLEGLWTNISELYHVSLKYDNDLGKLARKLWRLSKRYAYSVDVPTTPGKYWVLRSFIDGQVKQYVIEVRKFDKDKLMYRPQSDRPRTPWMPLPNRPMLSVVYAKIPETPSAL